MKKVARRPVNSTAHSLRRHRRLNFVTTTCGTARLYILYHLLRYGGDDGFASGTYLAVSVLRR